MRIKTITEDFGVEELLQVRLNYAGSWAVYRVSKSGRTTLDVQTALATTLGLSRHQVVFPALKDKEADTIQHVSLPLGLESTIQGQGYRAERLGYTDRPLSPLDLRGNRFTLRLRELSDEEAERLIEVFPALERQGLPNYFDQQRFGSFAEGWGFIGKAIIQRDAQAAVQAYLTRPFVGDPRVIRRFKHRAAGLWPNWPEIMAIAPRPSNYRSVLTFLIDHPQDYRKALNLIPQRLLSLYLSAYQSYLWNRIAAQAVQEMTQSPHFSTSNVDIVGQEWPVYRCDRDAELGPWAELAIPLPSHTARYGGNAALAVRAVLSEEGLVLGDLKARVLKRAYLAKGRRNLLLFPQAMRVGVVADDDLYPGCKMLQVSFDLPRGSYATLVLQIADALSGVQGPDRDPER